MLERAYDDVPHAHESPLSNVQPVLATTSHRQKLCLVELTNQTAPSRQQTSVRKKSNVSPLCVPDAHCPPQVEAARQACANRGGYLTRRAGCKHTIDRAAFAPNLLPSSLLPQTTPTRTAHHPCWVPCGGKPRPGRSAARRAHSDCTLIRNQSESTMLHTHIGLLGQVEVYMVGVHRRRTTNSGQGARLLRGPRPRAHRDV